MMGDGGLATRVLYVVIVACVVVLGAMATIVLKPSGTEAAGIMADLQCLPYAVPPCGCGQSMTSKGCKSDPSNRWMCPCFDNTSGFVTPGVCISTRVCQAQGQPGMPQMPMMPMPPPPSPSQGGPCGTGTESVTRDINGVIASTTNASSTPGCDPNAFNNSFVAPTFPTFDSSIFNTPGTAGSFGDIGAGNVSGPENNVVSSLLDGTINLGGSSNTSGSIVPGGSTASSTPRPPFGSANGVSGDVRLQGTAVTLMVSNREVARGTQVSGMYGYSIVPGVTALTVFKTMCGLRPWNTSYLSYIIPSAYFDSLCTARGFALGARITGSTANTAAKPASATPASPVAPPPPPPAPPAYLGSMSAEIWAVPPTVSNGNRTSVFWNAKGALTCSVTSSDGNFSGSSLSGHASTQPLNKNTTFTIYCQSATSSVSNQVVVPVQ